MMRTVRLFYADFCESSSNDNTEAADEQFQQDIFRISELHLEEKEIEIGELQLEVEKLHDVIDMYEEANQLFKGTE